MNHLLQPGHHPDADHLNAFVEHVLSAHEQQQMLAHLAACPDCRALVYLAQQADPLEITQAQTVITRRPWFSRWLSGWGPTIQATAIACLILLTFFLRKTPTPANQTTPTTTASVKQVQPPLPASQGISAVPAATVNVSTKAARTHLQTKQRPTATGQIRQAAAAPAPAAPIASAAAMAIQQSQLAPQIAASGESIPAPILKAQSLFSLSGGGITGTVTDPQGKVIVKAQVTATNTDTGVAVNTVTTSEGVYAFNDLPVGNYNVEVAAKGFQRLLQENVNVDNASMFAMNTKLTIGGENTTITVTDAPPYLDATDATLGGTIENELYTSLPLSMQGGPRDPTAFNYLSPGVQETVAQNNAGAATAGSSGIYGGTGQNNLNANYVEGVPASNIAAQGSGTATANAVNASTASTSSAAPSAAVPAVRKPLPALPSKLPVLALVDNASHTLALDTAGTLFRSDDAGVTWLAVPVQWQGRGRSLRVTQPQTQARQAAAINAANARAAMQQTQGSAPLAPAFELTTDSGVIYTSSDGLAWQPK